MARVLILACGNPLRGDDGAAWHAAEMLRQTLPSNQVEILCLHQFTPELAEAVSRVDTVIFIDAAVKGVVGNVVCEPVGPETAKSNSSHHLAPGGVLLLAEQLYGASPRAFMVSLCGKCFDHGEKLSEVVAAALPELTRTVATLITRESKNSSGSAP
jgi:hydrogenase maturation protease